MAEEILATIRLVVDGSQAARGADQASRAMRKTGGAADEAGSKLDRLGKRGKSLNDIFKGVVRQLVTFVSVFAALRAVRSAIRTIADFEFRIVELGNVTGATTRELLALESAAREAGATTKFTASQAAEGLLFLSRAGFSASEAAKGLSDTLNLATAANIDLAKAANISANVLRGFGIEVDEINRVADDLVNTANKSNTTVEELGQALSQVAPLAKNLGISIEEVNAAIGTLSDSGIKGSRAGVALRNIFLRLVNPTGEAAAVINSLGFSLRDLGIENKDLVQSLNDLSDANLSAAQSAEIFQNRTVAAVGVLSSKQGIQKVEALVKAQQDGAGAAEEAANKLEDTLTGSYKEFISTVEAVILANDDFTVSIKNSIQTFTNAIRFVNSFNVEAGKLDSSVTNLAFGLDALGTAIKAIGTAVALQGIVSLTVNFKKLNAIVLGTTVAIGALDAALDNLDETEKKTRKLNDSIRSLGFDSVEQFEAFTEEAKETGDQLGILKQVLEGLTDSQANYGAQIEASQVTAVLRTIAEAYGLAGQEASDFVEEAKQIVGVNREIQNFTIGESLTKTLGNAKEEFSSFEGVFTNTLPILDSISFGFAKKLAPAIKETQGIIRTNQEQLELYREEPLTEFVDRAVASLERLNKVQKDATEISKQDQAVKDLLKGVYFDLDQRLDSFREKAEAAGRVLESTTENTNERIDAEKLLANEIEKASVVQTAQNQILLSEGIPLTQVQIEQIRELTDAYLAQKNALEDRIESTVKLQEFERDLATTNAELIDKTRLFKDQSETTASVLDKLKDGTISLVDTDRILAQEIEKIAILQGAENSATEANVELTNAQKNAILDNVAALQAEETAFINNNQLLEEQQEKRRKLIATLEDQGKSVGRALSSALKDLATGSERFEDVLKNLVFRLEDLIFELLVAKPLIEGVAGAFSGGGTGTGPIASVLSGLIASKEGNVFGNGKVVPFARGGVIEGPRTFPLGSNVGLAGEAGPEAIMPLTRIGNTLGVASEGGGSVNNDNRTFNLSFSGVVGENGFRRSVAQARRSLEESTRSGERKR